MQVADLAAGLADPRSEPVHPVREDQRIADRVAVDRVGQHQRLQALTPGFHSLDQVAGPLHVPVRGGVGDPNRAVDPGGNGLVRAGIELNASGLSILAEAESTLGIVDDDEAVRTSLERTLREDAAKARERLRLVETDFDQGFWEWHPRMLQREVVMGAAVQPWLLTWLEQQTDSAYWRRGSVRPDYDRIECPVMLVAVRTDQL